MKKRTRIYYSQEQKDLMWDRWKKGDTLHTIGRLFDRGHSSISGVLSVTGGIRPPKRKRSKLSLTLAEREEISRGLVTRLSIRSIATHLKRSPSTISREINRNGGYHDYRATQAEQSAWERAKRPQCCKLANNKRLSLIVSKKLRRQWSPQQIAGWLKREYPNAKEY